MSDVTEPILRLRNVSKSFHTSGGTVAAVNNVSLEVRAGECVGLIGESGSGKSTLARLAIGLQPCDSGTITVAGADLARLRPRELQRRRAAMTMVFQDPLGSLNPRHRVRAIVEEPLRIHSPKLSAVERTRRVDEALRRVALDPELGTRRPASLSGGQQQRVSIARAIVTGPALVVLDEPTSALDLSVQAQILDLLSSLRESAALAFLFISHDIKCVSYLSDRIAVMYRGRVLEQGRSEELLANPAHPYTEALIAAALPADPRIAPTPTLEPVNGAPGPDSSLCPFRARCPYRQDRVCDFHSADLFECGPDHQVVASCGTRQKSNERVIGA